MDRVKYVLDEAGRFRHHSFDAAGVGLQLVGVNGVKHLCNGGDGAVQIGKLCLHIW